MTTLNAKLDALTPERRRLVDQRTDALVAEELSLRQLRRAVRKTQVEVAEQLGVKQENVSRLEQRQDLLLSTLGRYIQAMGGRLSLLAEFPDRPPVLLTELGLARDPDEATYPAPNLDSALQLDAGLQVNEESPDYEASS